MENNNLKFGTFFWRITSSHIVTYFIMGIIAYSLLNYEEAFSNSSFSCFMKPTNSLWVMMGPVLQVFRGLVFSIALWFVKDCFLFKKNGWLILWLLLIGLSILSTTGPTPGSIEGFIYTKVPIQSQLTGYIEVLPQTFLFSIAVFYWYKNPKKIWNILSIILVALIVILCTMGLLVTK